MKNKEAFEEFVTLLKKENMGSLVTDLIQLTNLGILAKEQIINVELRNRVFNAIDKIIRDYGEEEFRE